MKRCVFTFFLLLNVVLSADSVAESTVKLIDSLNNTQKSYRVYTENGAQLILKPQTDLLQAQASLIAEKTGKRVEARLSVKRELIAETVKSVLDSGKEVCGIDFEFSVPDGYAGKKALVVLNFGNGVLLDRTFVLEKGRNRYRFTPKLAAKPFNWNNLKNVLIYFRTSTSPFLEIGEIRLFIRQAAPARPLKLQKMPEPVEILPSGRTFSCFFQRPELKQIESDVQKITVAFNKKELLIHSLAKFKKAPLANETRHDDRVYLDDSLEIFFASALDNRTYDQFCINAKGTVRDERYGFDNDAVMVRNQLEHNFKFSKNISFSENILDIQLRFPLEEFGIEPGKSTLTLMQLAQQIDGVSRVLGISSMNRNFDIASFTPVVFNHRKFGSGKIAIRDLEFSGSGGSAVAAVKAEFSGFKPGKYKLGFIFSTPDYRRIEVDCGSVKIGEKVQTLGFRLPDIPDVNGTYTLFAVLKNSRGDLAVAGVRAVNQKPLEYRFAAGDFQPQLKKYVAGKGVFHAGKIKNISVAENATARTLQTAEIFRKYLSEFAGALAKISTRQNAEAILKIDPALQVKPEGYTVKVTPGKVIITGKDEAGLYYGIQTFIQMVKMPMKRTAESPVKCCEITDYPDMPVRIAYLWHPRSVPGGADVAEGTDVKYICNFIERFAAANKLNYLILRIDKSLMFESHPEFRKHSRKRYISMSDLKEISRFCREHFIEIVPKLPGGGHDGLLDIFPEFREGDWKATADVKHPEYMKIYLGCVQELLDATNCRFFTPGGDEWYFKKRKPGKTSPEDAGKYKQNFLDFHLELHKYLKERNVRMAMLHDMLIPDKNGRNFDIYQTADQLPKDIVVMVWSPSLNEKKLKDKGFELWYVGTGEEIPSGTAKLYNGFGSALYLFGTELSWKFPGAYKRLYKWFISGDAAWNMFSGKKVDAAGNLASGRLSGVQSLFAESANAAAAVETVPIELPASAKNIDRELQRLLPENYPHNSGNLILKKSAEYGNILMKTTNRALAVTPGMAEIVVPVNEKCSSLIFLHSAFETAQYRKSRKPLPRNSVKNVWHRGYPVANHRIVYTDGTVAHIPIRLGAQIDWFQTQPASGIATDTRYMHIAYDQQNRAVFLYQYEWVNPHPEKPVKSLVIAHDNPLKFKSLIFAISRRNVKNMEN